MYYQPYSYRVNQWSQTLSYLQQSLYAEEMVCAMSTQLLYIPATKDLKGNNEMHNHLVPASYHRVTAVGAAIRLSNGEEQPSIVSTLTNCIRNAEKQDKGVRAGIKTMEENAPTDYKAFVKVIMQWQQQAENSLAMAKQSVQSMGYSSQSDEESPESDYTY
ncbi:hypothetical protein LCL95_01190 [Bacillus timonensis]|nr:hypothetical protein [Bacillus timonensis]